MRLKARREVPGVGAKGSTGWAALWVRACQSGSRVRKDSSGQAMVESAIVMPLMVFLILAIIQLAMVQHARIMTEYAAFNAARAGIVWNADRFIMENAAIISLLPTNEGLVKEGDFGDPMKILKRILQRALLYQINRRLSQATAVITGKADAMIAGALAKLPDNKIANKIGSKAGDYLKDGAADLANAASDVAEGLALSGLGALLGASDDRMVRVDILSPRTGIMSNIKNVMSDPLAAITDGGGMGGHFGKDKREIAFDDPGSRAGSRLTIRVRYMYMMRIPFANWVIHGAWLAGKAGQQLYGAVWNPQTIAGETGFRNVANFETPKISAGMLSSKERQDLNVASSAARQGVFLVPLYASYTMRMQSDVYRTSVQQQ